MPGRNNGSLLYATTNAPVGADRQWSTVFDAPLNGRASPVMPGRNNGSLLYATTNAPVGAEKQWSTVFDAPLNGRASPVLPGIAGSAGQEQRVSTVGDNPRTG